MNDTHGETGRGWYGFDLDGTLAKYDGWKGIDHIGEPVKPMVDLIKRMHDEGKVVKIVTARVAPRKLEDGTVGLESAMISSEDMRQFYNGKDDNPFENGYVTHVRLNAKEVVAYWCSKNLGFIPEITHQKDHLMLELYDDRVKQVVPNEGWLVEDIAMSKRKTVTIDRVEVVNAKWWDRLNWFFLGALLTCAVLAIVVAVTDRTKPLPEATEKLHEAIHEFMESQREARE
jgi:hypothetical protein